MSFDYSKTADTSLRLLTRFGQDVTRTSYTAGTYDPSTGSVTPSAASTTRKGVVLPYPSGITMIRGALIQVDDVQLLLDASGPMAQTDHYTIGGIEYVVLTQAPLTPGGTVVLWDIHLRLA